MSRPTKVTPALVRVIFKHTTKNLTSVQIADKVGLGASTVRKLRTGQLPLDPACFEAWQETFGATTPGDSVNNRSKPPSGAPIGPKVTSCQVLVSTPATAPIFRTAKKLAPEVSTTAEAVPSTPTQIETEKEDTMLLRHLRFSPKACADFKITRDPFIDELQCADDVFITDAIRDVRAALRQTAKYGGMLAVVGEVGSGKSILRRDLHEWINREGESIIVVEPYVTNMEDSDVRGKNLRAKDIEGAVIRALDPQVRLAANTQDRTLQMHRLLKASGKLGQKHVIVVEEAHALSIPTLKHLKRLYELDDGFRRLLGIILIGQTELEGKLSERNADVREMVGRCAVVNVSSLDNHVGAYLRHKFERVGLDANALIAPDAIEEITARLRQTVSETWGGKRVQREQSLCYPLAINNLVTRAMNEAVKIGALKVNRGLIVAAVKGQ